eukprot:363626-Chlamydomonas_euryale.AAC.9
MGLPRVARALLPHGLATRHAGSGHSLNPQGGSGCRCGQAGSTFPNPPRPPRTLPQHPARSPRFVRSARRLSMPTRSKCLTATATGRWSGPTGQSRLGTSETAARLGHGGGVGRGVGLGMGKAPGREVWRAVGRCMFCGCVCKMGGRRSDWGQTNPTRSPRSLCGDVAYRTV